MTARDFSRLYGDIARDTGWTFSQIDELSMPQVRDLQASWEQSPPLFQMVSAWAGYKAPSDTSTDEPGPGPFQKVKSIEEARAAAAMYGIPMVKSNG